MPMKSLENTQCRPGFGMFRIISAKGKRASTSLRRGEHKSIVRRAVAAVETAITLPLLVLLVFGSIEIANSIFLAQTLSFASYEGAREAVRPGATVAQVNDRIAQIMLSRGIQNYSVSITPQLTAATTRGTMMTVRVEAAMSALSVHSTGLTSEQTTSQEVCMVKH